MKITKRQLRRIIREEKARLIRESRSRRSRDLRMTEGQLRDLVRQAILSEDDLYEDDIEEIAAVDNRIDRAMSDPHSKTHTQKQSEKTDRHLAPGGEGHWKRPAQPGFGAKTVYAVADFLNPFN
jgi:hypothetical protein